LQTQHNTIVYDNSCPLCPNWSHKMITFSPPQTSSPLIRMIWYGMRSRRRYLRYCYHSIFIVH